MIHISAVKVMGRCYEYINMLKWSPCDVVYCRRPSRSQITPFFVAVYPILVKQRALSLLSLKFPPILEESK